MRAYIFIAQFKILQFNNMYRWVCLILLLFLTMGSLVGDQESIAVTIYNNNFAMVKDVRQITFDKGNSFLFFTDVSQNINTQTVTFKAIKNPEKIRVYEQNFEKNLINKNAILDKYIQKNVEVIAVFGQQARRITGKLLGYSSGYIIQTSTGISMLDNVQGITLQELPQGFFTVPTLNWKVYSDQAITTSCEVAYRTSGFSWKADYTLTLNQEQTQSDIGGWVTIDNKSGKKYVNAKLKLIAGDVNTVAQPSPIIRRQILFAKVGAAQFDAAPSFSEKSFADYHLYTLSKPVTLNESSQKQVQFIPKAYNVGTDKFYRIDINAGGYSQSSIKASNKLKILNSASKGLGIPFPKGTFRVFKADKDDGSLQFIGESSIDHTPIDQNITITTGNAFDIVADLYSQNRQSFSGGGYQATMNLTITNHGEKQAKIEVHFNNYYGDNLNLSWNTNSVSNLKNSANQYIWTKTFSSDEKFAFEWTQLYRP